MHKEIGHIMYKDVQVKPNTSVFVQVTIWGILFRKY